MAKKITNKTIENQLDEMLLIMNDMQPKAFKIGTDESVDIRTAKQVITKVYNPISTAYQQQSDLIIKLAKKFEDDVDAYDNKVSSKVFTHQLKIEFLKKWEEQDKKVIQIVNDNHPTLRTERYVKYI